MASEQKFNINFVQEVEKHPCLYNYTLVEYSRKDFTDKAWSDVSKAVNLTVSESKERWKNLRAVYVRHKKQARNGMASRKPYYLEDAMEFTLPYVKSLNGNPPKTTAEFEVDDNDDDNTDPINLHLHSPEPSLRGHSSASHSPQPSYKSPISKRRRDSNDDLQEYINSKISRIQDGINSQQEANTLFLFSLLPDLNQMSSNQIRMFKRKVLNYIDEILQNTTKCEQIF